MSSSTADQPAGALSFATWYPTKRPATWFEPSVFDYARRIIARHHFAQANWGDTEWGALLGYCGTDCNGVEYGPYLGSLLVETLVQPRGIWQGYSPGPKLEDEAHAWLENAKDGNRWVLKSVLPDANTDGKLAPFFRACRTRYVCIVGPEHLLELSPAVVGDCYHVNVPDRIAWTATPVIADSCRRVIRDHRVDLLLFAAGSASNLIIHELWPQVSAFCTLIDVGAVLDPYVGEFSRNRYRYTPNLNDRLRANLEP